VIEGNAAGGNKNACAIFTEFAMNEDFLSRSLVKKREEFSKLSGSGRGKSADRNGDEVNA
jgi:hypothetical protein